MITSHLNFLCNLYPKTSLFVLNKNLKFSSEVAPKIARISKENFEMIKGFSSQKHSPLPKIMHFDEFKAEYLESYDQYKQSLAKITTDEKELHRAYKSFCNSQYSLYKIMQKGGNPALMY